MGVRGAQCFETVRYNMTRRTDIRSFETLDEEDRYICEKMGVDEFICRDKHPRVSFFERLDFYRAMIVEGRYYVYRSPIWLRTIIVFDELTSEFILSYDRYKDEKMEELIFRSYDDLVAAYKNGKIKLL